jgi:hypothetical protein
MEEVRQTLRTWPADVRATTQPRQHAMETPEERNDSPRGLPSQFAYYATETALFNFFAGDGF